MSKKLRNSLILVCASVSCLPLMAKASPAASGRKFSSAQEFVTTMKPYAEEVGKEYNIDPKILVSLAAIESGWGKHQIVSSSGVNSYNLFSIKGRGENTVRIKTSEFYNHKKVHIEDNFRRYSNYGESFRDFAKLITQKARYKSAFAMQKVGEKTNQILVFAKALQRAGYSTNPKYGEEVYKVAQNKAMQVMAV